MRLNHWELDNIERICPLGTDGEYGVQGDSIQLYTTDVLEAKVFPFSLRLAK